MKDSTGTIGVDMQSISDLISYATVSHVCVG